MPRVLVRNEHGAEVEVVAAQKDLDGSTTVRFRSRDDAAAYLGIAPELVKYLEYVVMSDRVISRWE